MSTTAYNRPTGAAVVAAFLLPPLSVFLLRGLGAAFWVGVLLTLVGIVPGIAFALVNLYRPDLLAPLLR